ncbi:MAG: efflux RND transporter permease subunit [Gemmatimonadota bacterium]
MKLPDLSISRPVLTSMVSVALVLFGAISYTRLSVREYPDIDRPVVSVTTTLRGANPQVMESAVTDVLEEELSSVEGLRTMTSSSGEQSSTISLEFTLDRDIEAAAQDVRDKVSRVRGRLPEQVLEPVVAKQDGDAFPFMFLALSAENYDLLQLTDIADRQVKSRLQTVPGVARAQIFGERRYSMRIWLDAEAMASRGITVQDVRSAVRTRSVEIPAGRIESSRREFTVRSLGELKTPEEFGEMTVANADGRLVRLRDIARVELGPESDRAILRYDGTPAVAVGVIRQSRSNLIEISDGVRGELDLIRETLPPGVELALVSDGAEFVRRAIQEAQETLILAGFLVVLIIFFFLRNVRATLIPAFAIPTSIVATFGVLYALDFSINNLTLLALILAMGIVVDDAIIVMENAYRHQEKLGETPEEAARKGTSEIAFAVIATTVALIAVFAPLTFIQGTTGKLFGEFALAMSGAVAISSFIALTLTPMLCARLLRVPESHGALFNVFERLIDRVTDGYAVLLRGAMRFRWLVVAGGVGIVIMAGALFQRLQVEFLPPEDRGSFTVFTQGPEGSALGYTDEYQRQVEAVLSNTDDVRDYFSVVGFGGVNTGIVFVRLEDWDERDRATRDVVNEVRPQLLAIPGVFAFASEPPALGGLRGSPVNFVIRNPDFDSLVVGMDRLVGRARGIQGLVNVNTDLQVNKPELVVSYERDRAEDLDVAIADVSETLQAMLGGQRIATFTRANRLYDVIIQLDSLERATPTDMSGLYIRGRDGALIQLDQVATVSEGVGPQSLPHYNRVRSATLTASLEDGFALGAALDSLYATASEVLPPGTSTALAGESRELEDSGNALGFAFVLALVVVFMVLAAQFESLVHPFTVILAVPLAVTGALATLFVTGSTLNLFSQIGMILLIGLVTKNSILLVEYANQLKDRGLSSMEAMLESGRIRLRPILMTSVATIAGTLPIALGLGAGSESRRPLGYAVVGGMLFSTLLTLFLVPVVYVMLDAVRERLRVRRPRSSAAVPEPSEA